MNLPPLPEPAAYLADSMPLYSESQVMGLQRDTVEACAKVLLESGYRSTGIPAYEFLANKLKGLK
jgi:hypothetical protein